VVLADNHFPEFVLPICGRRADAGLPIVLDIDRPTGTERSAASARITPDLLRRGAALDGRHRETDALARACGICGGFVAVTDGAKGAPVAPGAAVQHVPAFAVNAVDTLAAGDVFHGAFALALAEGRAEPEALRFASAAAAVKCTRFGGIAGTPGRAEAEALLSGEPLGAD
jgi:sulfofructose kinase